MSDLLSEMDQCLNILGISPEEVEQREGARQSVKIREILREREFVSWCALPHKGRGVVLFDECPAANKLIFEMKGLSSSEWLNGLKMVGNVAPVRSIPGRSQETLPHVLGSCKFGKLLINSRHNRIRSILADPLKKTGLTLEEEVYCVGESNRRVYIIAFDPKTLQGYFIDPTVRMEEDKAQVDRVNVEKQAIYDTCIPFLLERYHLQHLETIGLLIGARKTITSFFEDFRKQFNLPIQVMEEVAITALKGSCQILQHHLYSSSFLLPKYDFTCFPQSKIAICILSRKDTIVE